MENKIFYGEYTLKYWITLMLKGNVVLPLYQREFVWDREDVIALIENIKDGLFIPPVTIGFYDDKNYIIDGQQRLTSLLIAYLRLFPKAFDCKNKMSGFADENDDGNPDSNESNSINWTYMEFLQIGNSKEKILAGDISAYDKMDKVFNGLDEAFFENHCIGFSYLIPAMDPKKYFSSVFKNINSKGKSLSKLETRQSMYYLKDGLEDILDPDCIKNIFVQKNDSPKERIDFIRYLSISKQYYQSSRNEVQVMKNYGKKMDDYYLEFIYACVNEGYSKMFGNINDKSFCRIKDLPDELKNWTCKIKNLHQLLTVMFACLDLYTMFLWRTKKLMKQR